MGALNLNDIGSTVIREYDTINNLNIGKFFIAIREWSDHIPEPGLPPAILLYDYQDGHSAAGPVGFLNGYEG